MTTPHEKQETNAPASVEHAAHTDSHATDSVPVRKTSVTNAMPSHAKMMNNLGHASIGHGANFAHAGGMMRTSAVA